MCSAPEVPKPVERQAVQLPKAADGLDNLKASGKRRLALAGLMTGAQGALGAPAIGKATLG